MLSSVPWFAVVDFARAAPWHALSLFFMGLSVPGAGEMEVVVQNGNGEGDCDSDEKAVRAYFSAPLTGFVRLVGGRCAYLEPLVDRSLSSDSILCGGGVGG